MHLSLLFLEINLPVPVFLHAISMLALSQYLILSTPRAASSSSTSKSHPSPSSSGGNPVLGISSLAIALSYLTTAYMPISENQFLHASVPVRLLLAGIAGLNAYMGEKRVGDAESERVRRTLWGIMVYDGLGAVWAGLLLGKWNGRVPGM